MYDKICSFENLLRSYKLARKSNRYKKRICQFDFFLESNLLKIQEELINETFITRPYNHFVVTDPKIRQIAAPEFRDRVVQHALVDVIEPLFENGFIYDSYACRKNKGTTFALKRIQKFLKASHSFYGKDEEIYFLKCDIRKFFPSISWDILLSFVRKKIKCPKTLRLIEKIVTTHQVYRKISDKPKTQLSLFDNPDNFEEVVSVEKRKGLPIGNLTSQLFANVYLNELDNFAKHTLKERWYGRYMDDFLIISNDKKHLLSVKEEINKFLNEKLKLTLHPNKSFVQNTKNGISFVGYRIFYDYVLIRGSTLIHFRKKHKKRLKQFKTGRITKEELRQSELSFKGHMKHANTWNLQKMLREKVFTKE
jgi:retron-type reverse transcriptase